MDTSKFCQSCAMPVNDNNRCTTNDGKVTMYCNYCMDGNGEFRQPDLTFDQMYELGIKGINNSKGNKFSKWMMKKSYRPLLQKMDRWK